MPAPPLSPIPAAELVEIAQRVIREARFPQLATLDGDQPRLRPVSPVKVAGFVIYVANLRSYHKTVELAANPKCELCYVDDRHHQVRLTAVAEVVTDRAVLEEIWAANPLLRTYLGSLENPALIVYRLTPSRVRYMMEWALEYYEVPLSA
jgi:general stress protein 26